MDEISAHLDRGWDLVQRGDADGAEASARRALEINTQSAEAYHLLGYAAALQGDFAEAVDSYGKAIALDDTYLEALLNAAEVYVHPLGDFDAALRLCDQALELVESEEEMMEVLLIRFDALMGKGDLDAAAELCCRLPAGPYENPTQTFLVGRAYYEIGDLDTAEALIENAIARSPDNAEAFYYLGLLKDDRRDARAATQAFLRSRQLDVEFPPPNWSLSPSAFEMSVRRAVQALDPTFRPFVRENEVYAADAPGVEVVVEGVDPRALVLVDAIASTGVAQASARVFVYQRNIERAAGSVDRVEAEIRDAMERELAAAFIEAGQDARPKMLN